MRERLVLISDFAWFLDCLKCMYGVEMIKALFVILFSYLAKKSHPVNECISCTFFEPNVTILSLEPKPKMWYLLTTLSLSVGDYSWTQKNWSQIWGNIFGWFSIVGKRINSTSWIESQNMVLLKPIMNV